MKLIRSGSEPALNLKPKNKKTLNPKNPKPQTLNPKPPNPKTLHPERINFHNVQLKPGKSLLLAKAQMPC